MDSRNPVTGFLHTLQLDGCGGCEPIPQLSPTDPIASPPGSWLHLSAATVEARDWLEQHSGLSEIAIEGLLAEETRPRVITRNGNVLLIIRGINLNPGAEPDDMVSVRIWSDGQRVISTQLRPLQSTVDLVRALSNGSGPENVSQLIVQWLDRVVDMMNGTTSALEDDVLSLEERSLLGERQAPRTDFARLRRQCIVLRRYLGPQREALTRLANEPLPWLDDLVRLQLREIADRQIRHLESLDEVRERAAVAHEELVSQLSEEMNQRMYVMSIAAALFLPLGFLTGLMGINVGGMPGVESEAGFWVVAGGCSLVLIGLLIIFKRRRWL